jgi:hypothetical protein
MPNEFFIFRALRQQLLWPSIHAAVDVYQRRRASGAEPYELIWRLIHICECTIITVAAAATSRVAQVGKKQEFLKLRERCYGITWNTEEESIEKGVGALDGSIDKWIEVIQAVSLSETEGSGFLSALRSFLVSSESEESRIDLANFARAWSRACDVPPSVTQGHVSVKEAFQAINSFRNRFAHVPFPYDQLQDIYRNSKHVHLSFLKFHRQRQMTLLPFRVRSP